jgi:uncharacterized protein (TIGR03437 family)
VGLKKRLFPSLLLISSIPILHAAPTLRVTASALGPISISAGGTAPSQTVEAYNIGDGSLSLTLSSSVTWITPTVGTSRACTTMVPPTPAANCIPLQFAFTTSSLAAGTYTGVVTITSPNTVDAPQNITVTVRVGGVEVYMAPNTVRDIPLTTNHGVNTAATTQDGNPWLSLALQGSGSFRFTYPYNIHILPIDGMPVGNYTGSVTTSGSATAGENLTIPVTMHLTTQPIADASPNQVSLRIAQGSPVLTAPFSPLILVNNLGQGSLTLQSATASGGSWLKTAGDFVPCMPLAPYCGYLSIDVTNLSPGDNSGTLTLATNAANGSLTVPIALKVVAKDAPLIYYQGVLDNGTFVPGDTVAAGDVMVVKGEQLATSYPANPAPPLPTQLGAGTVLVNGAAVPLYYASPGQLAFQMPYDTSGTALVQVQREGQTSNTVTVNVASAAPRIIAVVNPDSRCPSGTPPGLCVNTSDGAHPAQAGDALTIYAIGLGQTTPSVVAGAPAPSAEPLARVTTPSLVTFGTGPTAPGVPPFFIGLTPAAAGLYQANVTIPAEAPKGLLPIKLGVGDSVSNVVMIAIQ